MEKNRFRANASTYISDIDKEIHLEVLIHRFPNLRDSNLEYEFYMGKNELELMFDEKDLSKAVKFSWKTKLYFAFPERWLNIIEQRALIKRIFFYFPKIEEVVIKTESVYIIQTVSANCIGVLGDVIEEVSDCLDVSDECLRYLCNPTTTNLINAKSLNVLHA